jgi:NTE family protein
MRHACIAGLVLAGLWIVPPPALAEVPVPADRPRIGLVLAGGGAKGAAHIGVLRVLEELRVPIHCIAGTSMGALVGGTYATGMPAEQLERETRAIDWDSTVGTEGRRDRQPIERKLAGQNYTNALEIGVRDGSLRLPSGFLETQRIEDVIRALIADARLQRDFDSLAIPFRAVATDMVSGDMVVMGDGDLSVAMRASMALPGIFSPVVDGERVLSDGGLTRNLPVDIARDLCADIVIAVWLSTPQPSADQLANAFSLAGRALDVVITANERQQLATLGGRDIEIEVPMGEITTADFERTPEAIDLGRAAAERVAGQLRGLSLSEAEYAAWRDSVKRPVDRMTLLADVRIEGLDRVSPVFVESQLHKLRPGALVDIGIIREETDRIYDLGDFERVEYELSGPPEARVLEIYPVEKAWGPNFFRFDAGLDGQANGELQAILRAEHQQTWVNRRGGRWGNLVQIGRQTKLRTDLYQPVDIQQNFFVQPIAKLESNLEGVYDDGNRVARYFLRDLYGQLDIGANIRREAVVRVGLRSGWLESKVDTGTVLLPELDATRETALVAGFVFDTRDSAALATRGTYINLRYLNAAEMLGGEVDYSLGEAAITQSWALRGNSLNLILAGGAELSGDLPPPRDFRIGGIRSFPGLRPGELRGSRYWLAGGSYQWKVADILSLFDQSVFAGLRAQAARIGDRRDDINDGVLFGIAGSLSGRTPVGPFSLSLGWVNNDSVELQFSLGRPIAEGSAIDEVF